MRPTLAASPVPRCTVCSTNVTWAHAGRLLLHLLGDPLGAVADDHDRAVDAAGRSSAWMTCITIGRPQMQVQGLGARRPHPGALAGGEDDGGDGHVPF